MIFQVAAGLIGLVLLLAIFAFPETAYIRNPPPPLATTASAEHSSSEKAPTLTTTTTATTDPENPSPPPSPPKKKHPYLHHLRLFPAHGPLTTEPLPLLLLRPLPLILLPPILYTALLFASTIGFLVALTSNAQLAFSSSSSSSTSAYTYNFASYQVGLCFIAAVVGALAAIPAGGWLAETVADWGTRRNGGVREPEMRLPVLVGVVLLAPGGLLLFGGGVEGGWHW